MAHRMSKVVKHAIMSEVKRNLGYGPKERVRPEDMHTFTVECARSTGALRKEVERYERHDKRAE